MTKLEFCDSSVHKYVDITVTNAPDSSPGKIRVYGLQEFANDVKLLDVRHKHSLTANNFIAYQSIVNWQTLYQHSIVDQNDHIVLKQDSHEPWSPIIIDNNTVIDGNIVIIAADNTAPSNIIIGETKTSDIIFNSKKITLDNLHIKDNSNLATYDPITINKKLTVNKNAKIELEIYKGSVINSNKSNVIIDNSGEITTENNNWRSFGIYIRGTYSNHIQNINISNQQGGQIKGSNGINLGYTDNSTINNSGKITGDYYHGINQTRSGH